MKFIKIKTRPILPPKDDIYPILDDSLPKLKEGDVLLITSKILAIHQGRCIKIEPGIDKYKLIKKEAEKIIPSYKPSGNFLLTIKEHTLIPTSGIDESNGNGYYILWPKRPTALAKELCEYLQNKFDIKKLAVIITDSHTIPLRYGVMGISIGFFGLEPLHSYIGKKDIFGRKLKSTKVNIVDATASTAVLLMGEGNEQTPMIILRDVKFINFTEKNTHRKLVIPMTKDIYSPLLSVFKKKK
jgi:coenzyme F420-0:L-glutamate ligase